MSFVSGKMGQFRYFDQQLGHFDWAAKTVLDFGGNSGNLLRDPRTPIDPARYWCIDVSPAGLARGQDTFPQAHWILYDRYNFEFNPCGVKGLPIPDAGQRFELRVILDTLEPGAGVIGKTPEPGEDDRLYGPLLAFAHFLIDDPLDERRFDHGFVSSKEIEQFLLIVLQSQERLRHGQ